VAVSGGLLLILHWVKPEFDPSWRMVSEYAIGRNGWLMTAVFLSLTTSCTATVIAVRPHLHTLDGYVGLVVLLATAVAMAAAATFTTDSITTPTEALTAHGRLHGMAAMVGIPGFAIAAALITWSLSRNPAWVLTRGPLIWSACFVWFSLATMILTVLVLLPRNGGAFGPEVPIGWPNRLIMVSYYTWLTSSAWACRQFSRELT
jgi:hypothetical protein